MTPMLYSAAVKWSPIKVMLTYLHLKGEAKIQDIVSDLGSDMLYWTKIMSDFGFKIRRKAVKKPFNDFVVRECLKPLAEQLCLVESSNGKMKLTEMGRQVILKTSTAEWEIIRSRPREPLIYAATVSTILDTSQATMVSPWIDVKTAKTLTSGLKKHSSIQQLRIIVRKPNPETRKAIKIISEEISQLGASVQVRATPVRGPLTLHAKTTVTANQATITSANLQYTSLWKNFELGVYYKQTPEELSNLIEDLWETAQPIQL